MSPLAVGSALREATGDAYRQSWRLAILNTLFSCAAVGVALAALAWLPLLALVVLLGPLLAALAHCTVTLAQTEELRLSDGVEGLRLHWQRGLALGVADAAVVALGLLAIVVYARAHTYAWPLAFLVAYLLVLLAVAQLVLWPLAVFEPERPLREVVRAAFLALVRRPKATVGLSLALLLVNLLGAVAVLPLLTLTIAFSFLTAAHFALPRNPLREAAS